MLPIFFLWLIWSKRISYSIYEDELRLAPTIYIIQIKSLTILYCTQVHMLYAYHVKILLKIPKITSKSSKIYRKFNRLLNGQLIHSKCPSTVKIQKSSNRPSLSVARLLCIWHIHTRHISGCAQCQWEYGISRTATIWLDLHPLHAHKRERSPCSSVSVPWTNLVENVQRTRLYVFESGVCVCGMRALVFVVCASVCRHCLWLLSYVVVFFASRFGALFGRAIQQQT